MELEEKELEVAVKIIGESDDGQKNVFFSSLADALRAFLQGEISKLRLDGQDFFCWFSSYRAMIGKQVPGSFEENLIEAPVVFLKILGYDEKMRFFQPSSLEEAFQSLSARKNIQIYEQVSTGGPDDVSVVRNYMINFDWDEADPRRILLHLHNIDVKDNHFWRRDYHVSSKGADLILSPAPIFGEHHIITGSFNKN